MKIYYQLSKVHLNSFYLIATGVDFMKCIFLERHSTSEKSGTSLFKIFSGLEIFLSGNYKVIKMDRLFYSYTESAQYEYIKANINVDVAILTNPFVLRILRESGWKGKVLYFALGSLPRGGKNLRAALPYLMNNDVILFSCSSDLSIYNSMIAKGGPLLETQYFGINTEKFVNLGDSTISNLRRRFGYKDTDKILLYVGRITLEKNIHNIIRIFSDLVKKSTNYHLILVGEIQEIFTNDFVKNINVKTVLNNLIKENNIPETHINFITHLNDDELIQFYNMADVFINLTLHHDENFGFAQVESMSCGTPVICTSWGGLKDVVNQKVGCPIQTWITNSGVRIDWLSVRENLELVLMNNSLRRKMEKASRKWVLKNFKEEYFYNKIYTLIEDTNDHSDMKTLFTREGYKFYLKHMEKKSRGEQLIYSPIDPSYSSYNDSDYINIIKHYVSLDNLKITNESIVFRSSAWLCKLNDIYINQDPLWPSKHTVTANDKEIFNLIYLNDYLKIKELLLKFDKETLMESVINLWNSGMVGVRPG